MTQYSADSNGIPPSNKEPALRKQIKTFFLLEFGLLSDGVLSFFVRWYQRMSSGWRF